MPSRAASTRVRVSTPIRVKSTPIRRTYYRSAPKVGRLSCTHVTLFTFCSGRTTTVDRVCCAEVNTTTTPSRQLHHETRRPWRHHCLRLHVRDVTVVKEQHQELVLLYECTFFRGEKRKECVGKHISSFCDPKDVEKLQKHHAQGLTRRHFRSSFASTPALPLQIGRAHV